MQGPAIGPNGQAELALPGATLAPNEAQYPVGDGPTGMKCPQVTLQMQQFNCSLSFNLPPPSPAPSGSVDPNAKFTPKPKPTPSPTPTPTPQPSASSDDSSDNGDSGDNGASPSPTPPGTITLQMEPLPKDVPAMTSPDVRAMHVTPLVAMRLQSDTDFALNGYASVEYTLPRTQYAGRSFAIQLYSEGVVRGKRADQFLATYNKFASNDTTISFSFPTPKISVKRGQIWLLALYGLTFPPGTTPTPSPSPVASSSGSPTASAAPSPTMSP
jgi:hypothetical protein